MGEERAVAGSSMRAGRDAVEVARAFLDIVWAKTPPDDARLLTALDQLLVSAHDVHPGEENNPEIDPPRDDWEEVYGLLRERHPDYGHYAIADPLRGAEEAVLLADPIDDLLDLTSDLREVVWRGEHGGAGDAAWYFRFLYEAHWGNHARDLARYIHARLTSNIG